MLPWAPPIEHRSLQPRGVVAQGLSDGRPIGIRGGVSVVDVRRDRLHEETSDPRSAVGHTFRHPIDVLYGKTPLVVHAGEVPGRKRTQTASTEPPTYGIRRHLGRNCTLTSETAGQRVPDVRNPCARSRFVGFPAEGRAAVTLSATSIDTTHAPPHHPSREMTALNTSRMSESAESNP